MIEREREREGRQGQGMAGAVPTVVVALRAEVPVMKDEVARARTWRICMMTMLMLVFSDEMEEEMEKQTVHERAVRTEDWRDGDGKEK